MSSWHLEQKLGCSLCVLVVESTISSLVISQPIGIDGTQTINSSKVKRTNCTKKRAS
jgi:hypothetical protein